MMVQDVSIRLGVHTDMAHARIRWSFTSFTCVDVEPDAREMTWIILGCDTYLVGKFRHPNRWVRW